MLVSNRYNFRYVDHYEEGNFKLLFQYLSPVILWKKIGQPATNCNRVFNCFGLGNVSLITYQKSQKIPLREVTKKRDLF